MKFYDAHIHLFFQHSQHDLRDIFFYLEETGLAGFDALVIAEYPEEISTILKLIPEQYHEDVNLQMLDKQRNPFHFLNQADHLEIVLYLDARYMEKDIEQKIKRYCGMGFEGLKLFYVPEEDEVLKISGMEQAFGRTRKQSETVTSLLVESASSQGMSVLIHVDLRRYGEFVAEMMESYPQTNFNIAHFGFSRNVIGPMLDKYPNCYTDTASLMPFMRNDLSSYLNFMSHYRDKILFGSDAMIGWPEAVKSMMEFVVDFLNEPELSEHVFNKNYLTFHNRP